MGISNSIQPHKAISKSSTYTKSTLLKISKIVILFSSGTIILKSVLKVFAKLSEMMDISMRDFMAVGMVLLTVGGE
jgi:hypothetical protein